MFNRAKNIVIEGGQLVNVPQGDAHFHVGGRSNHGLDHLHQNVATGAFHDAAERGDPPKCYPQTRLAIRAEITLVFLQTGYSDWLSVDFIETLLGYDPGDVALALINMHALVQVPSSDDDVLNPNHLSLYHASLQDFLMDKGRTERFFLDARLKHADLARRLCRYITTASEKEYKNERRFSAILNGFIRHYLEVPPTAELVTNLRNFSLTSILSNIPLETFYMTTWDAFFDHLRTECSETNTELYQELRDEFDDWIRNRCQQYPEFIQRHISAVWGISGNYIFAVAFLPEIFNILMHSLPPSDAIRLRKLDMELLRIQKMPFMGVVEFNERSTLQNFFTDSSRAGAYFADPVKFGELAEAIVKVLCRSGDDRIPIVADSEKRTHVNDSDSLESKQHSTLKIEYEDLYYFPKILAAAPEDPKLAQLLWELAVQYKDENDDPISEGRQVMAYYALEYMERCGISVPEHVHKADCQICANYKPAFPSTLTFA